MVRDPRSGFWQALKLSAAALGVGLVVMSAGAARAGDDDDEDDGMTFEEKIIDNLMSGIGAKSMEKPGIEYRERSPLVVPPKLDRRLRRLRPKPLRTGRKTPTKGAARRRSLSGRKRPRRRRTGRRLGR